MAEFKGQDKLYLGLIARLALDISKRTGLDSKLFTKYVVDPTTLTNDEIIKVRQAVPGAVGVLVTEKPDHTYVITAVAQIVVGKQLLKVSLEKVIDYVDIPDDLREKLIKNQPATRQLVTPLTNKLSTTLGLTDQEKQALLVGDVSVLGKYVEQAQVLVNQDPALSAFIKEIRDKKTLMTNLVAGIRSVWKDHKIIIIVTSLVVIGIALALYYRRKKNIVASESVLTEAADEAIVLTGKARAVVLASMLVTLIAIILVQLKVIKTEDPSKTTGGLVIALVIEILMLCSPGRRQLRRAVLDAGRALKRNGGNK